MVEALIEIPFPGRSFVPPADAALGRLPDGRVPSYVAGPENGLAASFFSQLIEECGNEPPEQLPRSGWPSAFCLYGPTGVGKTHLARGLVAHWQTQRGPESAEYLTATDFRHQLRDAMNGDCVADFRRQVRGREMLVLDDIHELPADSYLMEELRCTLDDCREAGGIVVVTAPRATSLLHNLPDEIRSRLNSGPAIELVAPGPAARLAIVRHAATALGQPLADEAASRLAGGIEGIASQLFAALFELLAASKAPGRNDVAQVDLLLSERKARRCTLREVIAVVSRYYAVPQKMLKSSSRKQAIVQARATAVYLARELASVSYEDIGRALGGRDHSTVMHNYRTIDHRRRRDWQTQESLDELRRILVTR